MCPPPAPASDRPGRTPASGDELLRAGEVALPARHWEEARDAFTGVAERTNSAQAWDGLGLASWWLQDTARMFDAKQRAYTGYVAAGEKREAARVAASLANDFLDFRGETAVAQGWLKRAERLLEGIDADAERAWLSVWEARLVTVAQRDLAAGMPLVERAIALAERAGTPDVEVLALALRGLGRVVSGDVRAGMAELDEATAVALSGELSDPYTIGLTCCYLISACERTADWDRAGQWCHQLRAFCTERRLAVVLTNCRLQYAGVLMAHGEYEACEAELQAALRDVEIARPGLRAAVLARSGELRRRQGRIEDATAAFQEAGNHGIALLGGAALALDRGDVDGASERVERYMRRLPPEAELDRAMGLEMLVRVETAAGRLDQARTTLARLREAAAALDSPPLRAASVAAAAAVALASGDAKGATEALEDAADLYDELNLPFEAAASRRALARVVEGSGDRSRSASAAAPAAPLTSRELDVLRLVAEGLADRAIAERLFLSEHTVHRHLSNIRLKLDVSSRSAAVARALRDGLL